MTKKALFSLPNTITSSQIGKEVQKHLILLIGAGIIIVFFWMNA